MIGGIDIRIPTQAGRSTVEASVRTIRQLWADPVFENGLTGERYESFWDVPFGQIEELFVYRDAQAADQWDAMGAIPELSNTMIHLIADPGALTVVVDEQNAEAESILAAIRSALSDEILCADAELEAA